MLASRIQKNAACASAWIFSRHWLSQARSVCAVSARPITPAMSTAPAAESIMEYWFGPDWSTTPRHHWDKAFLPKWFFGGAAVDEEIKAKFSGLLEDMATGKLDPWIEHPVNCLAGVILMDQFSRNVYRNTPQVYALDTKALTWARHALATGRCDKMPHYQTFFLLMPFEHSEDVGDQEESVRLFEAKAAQVRQEVGEAPGAEAAQLLEALKMTIKYAVDHRDVVVKWGRFPHRNAILGRTSTPEEEAGLKDGSIKKF